MGTITTANSATVPAGNVISQNPATGTSIPEGSSVDLVISLGPSLDSITITPATATLTTSGEILQLTVTGNYSDGSAKDLTAPSNGTTYTSSDPSIATVTADGIVTAIADGTTSITASNSNLTAAASITVNLAPQLTSLSIFPSQLTLTASGETYQLSVTGIYTDGSAKNLAASTEGTTYGTGNGSIATVGLDGLATAINDGATVITITNGSISEQLPVTVNITTIPIPDPTAYISGRVLDVTTGLPIEGAIIDEASLPGIVATDAEGRFTYSISEGGKYIFFINKDGYISAKREIVVESSKNASIEDEYLTPYETYSTFIDAASGGTATNAAGDIEVIFPPDALPDDLDLTITRFLSEKGYPANVPEGQVFVDSVQFNEEHIDFNSPVTIRFSNKWDFPAGTQIPFAFGSHHEHDPFPELPYFDPGMGQVTADGQWVEIQVSHFSCPSFVAPSCNIGNQGEPPAGGQAPPEVPLAPPPSCPQCNECCDNEGGSSTIYNSVGVLKIEHDITPYKSLGISNGLSLTYRSDTAVVDSVLDIEVSNDSTKMDIPDQMTFQLEVEGVKSETKFVAEEGNFIMAYYFDGKNAKGDYLSTGAYKIRYGLSNDYTKNFYTPDYFGGPPKSNTGITIPDFVSYTNFTERDLIVNNQINSPLGAGWSLSGIDRLYPDPFDPDSALLARGSGSMIFYSKSSDRLVRENIATGLNYPTGIVYDSAGDVLVSDRNNNRVLRIKPDKTTSTEANLTQPNGLAIAANDDLYIALKGGEIYKKEKATGNLSLYVTLPSTTDQSVQDIEIDSQGNLYVYDTGGNHFLYKIDTARQITTLIQGSNKLLLSSMAINPADDELYLVYNNQGFIDCGSSFISKYSSQGAFAYYDRLNSPAGITFDPDGNMYMVERECGEQDYKVYSIDKLGLKKIFNDRPIGTEPNFDLAQLTHDIAWSPQEGVAIAGTLDNNVYHFKEAPLSPPVGEYSTLTLNADGTYTRTLKDGTAIEFDVNGLQTSKTDRNNNTFTYTYDSAGKLKDITGPVGKTTTLSYNSGLLESIIGPAGRTTLFEHDASGNLISITDPDDAVSTYTYNSDRLLTSKTVPTGETYSYEYDQHNRVNKSVSPTGEIRQFSAGKMQTIVNDLPAGEGTETNPAQLRDLSEMKNTYTDAEGNITEKTIDITGNVSSETDALGRTTSYERDKDLNITKTMRPNGEVETMTYDSDGNLLNVTTASTGGTTTYTYDSVFNQVTSITDPNGNTTTMEYDAQGNLITITDPLNNQTLMEYDSRGLLLTTTDALNNVTTNTYDAAGNLISTTGPLGNATTFTYDTAGNLLSVSDAEGKTTNYEYDITNNLINVTTADNAETSYAYSSGERCPSCGASGGSDLLTEITDANANVTTFNYNEIGQLTTITNHASLETLYAYDLDRKLTAKTDPNGQTTNYQYDSSDQLTQKDLPDNIVKYTYNSSGSLTSVEDTDSLVIMDYDLQNRLVLENALGGDPGNVTITTDLTIPSGNFGFDNRNITVDGATLTINGRHTFNSLNLINGANVTHEAATTTKTYSLNLVITNSLTVDSTSSIDVTEKGYLGSYRDGNNVRYGRTIGNTTTGGSFIASGGSYGGMGGQYESENVNSVYGSLYNPNELGSGGGGWGSSGNFAGNGGGLVRITAGDIILDGSIKANGGGGAQTGNGGGSGGGVYIQTGILSGTGMITASGGNNSTAYNNAIGGGGGRIAIYYDDLSGFDTGNITAYGGVAFDNGGAGTIYLKDQINQVYGDLIVNNNNISTTGYSTPLPSVATGTSTGLTADTLTDTNRSWRANNLVGIYLNPNKNQSSVFQIISNDNTTITTDLNDGNMTTVAAIGDTYRGKHIFDYFDIKGLAGVETGDDIKVLNPNTLNGLEITGSLKSNSLETNNFPVIVNSGGLTVNDFISGGVSEITITNADILNYNTLNVTTLNLDNSTYTGSGITADTITLNNNSQVSHPSATTGSEYRLEINVTNTLSIDSTSSIDVTEKGYLGSYRNGNNDRYGRTIGNTTTGGSFIASGGSYGGMGGQYESENVNSVYGSLYNPNELGSGGGGWGSSGNFAGNGGGLVRITAGDIILDGSIKANGGGGAQTGNGGGSGGGVYIQTGILSGTGMITASGGNNSTAYNNAIGGGGGRIAIYYDDLSGFDTGNITAYGGTAFDNGGAGTIYLKDQINQVYGDLIVDNGGITTTGYSTPLPSVATGISTGLTADTLTDDNGNWFDNELIGIYLNPNTTQSSVFEIISNDATMITTDLNDGDMTLTASTGNPYIGEHYLDNLIIVNAAAVDTLDAVFYNTLDITGGFLQADNVTLSGKLIKKDSAPVRLAKATNPVDPVNPVKNLKNLQPSIVNLNSSLRRNSSLGESAKLNIKSTTMLASLNPTTNDGQPATNNLQRSKQSIKKVEKETLTPDPRPLPPASGVDSVYEYDLNGNRSKMITPFGEWNYVYDSLNRLTSITNPNNEVTIFGYDVLGRRTSMTYDNGVVTTYSYNDNSWLTSMSTDLGATNITSYVYTYDNVGNRETMTDNDGVHNYTYDDVYRLIDATHPHVYNPTESFTYDDVGNRMSSQTSTSYSYDNLNRLNDDDQYTYSYDSNGNMTSKIDKISSAVTTYQYDSENRLIQVVTPADVVQYQYDGFGRRIAKTVNGVVTKYVYDWRNILFELDGNDQIKARYTHGPGIDEPISVDRDTNGDGNFDTTYYFHQDGLGSVTAMTNGSGAIVQTYTYDSFGNIVNQTGSVENSYTYTGREWDQEAGLYYYRARYMDPTTGRFLSEDPIGFDGGINFYAYVKNNPVNLTDPTGLIPPDFWKKYPRKPTPVGPFGPVCGSGQGATLIPDGPWKDACKIHDKCYSECGGPSKLKCDLDFLKNSGNIYYFAGTFWFGKDSFDEAREDCCGEE